MVITRPILAADVDRRAGAATQTAQTSQPRLDAPFLEAAVRARRSD
jgi:hypothetical protein